MKMSCDKKILNIMQAQNWTLIADNVNLNWIRRDERKP